MNEKLAINTFANGLRDSELRTIIGSRTCSSLKDATVAAKAAKIKRLLGNYKDMLDSEDFIVTENYFGQLL